MDYRDGIQTGTYFSSFDNAFVYFTNLSPYYIFSVLVSVLAVISVCWYRTVDKGLQADSANTDEMSVEETEPGDTEDLKSSDSKVKENLCNNTNEFPEASNDAVPEKDCNDLTQENVCGQQDMMDIPGGDGNYEQLTRDADSPRTDEMSNKFEESTLSSPITRFKKARQAAILEMLASDMSDQQLMEEKETEASQMAAIWGLLKQQQDQFNIGTEDELKDQLLLYR